MNEGEITKGRGKGGRREGERDLESFCGPRGNRGHPLARTQSRIWTRDEDVPLPLRCYRFGSFLSRYISENHSFQRERGKERVREVRERIPRDGIDEVRDGLVGEILNKY